MNTECNILVAFILNLFFSIFEFIGGIFTGSVAILSDAVHDLGDSVSIGISYFLEKISKKKPDNKYTYGYMRYSVIGGFITSLILVIGSVVVIYNAVVRVFIPIEIKYNAMIVFAIVGACVNLLAAFITSKGGSINQKAVNLHMLEDVLGWVVVLIGAVVMRFTNFSLIDPIMSIAVSIYILINAIKVLKEVSEIFLDKVPSCVDLAEIEEHIKAIDGIIDVHHIHIWSLDGENNLATMHVVTEGDHRIIKNGIRSKLRDLGIYHVTIEIETSTEACSERSCNMHSSTPCKHHHHNH